MISYNFNFLLKFILLISTTNVCVIVCILFSEIPKFCDLMKNVTITVGRDAVLTCAVENLSTYKIAWLRVDTQTILTIQNLVITKNHRIAVTNSDQQVWKLHIKNVRIADKGWYMCQINTDPMKSQIAYIGVVAPPDILDYPTSSDMIVSEGNNVTLQCAVSGSPTPVVTWKKEDGSEIYLDQISKKATYVKNSILILHKVDWKHSGIYLCIASNGVPPTVSKRISLVVQHAPKVYIRNQLIGATTGETIMLECETEAFPKPIHYWTLKNGQLLTTGEHYETIHRKHLFKIKMTLLIKEVTRNSFDDYFCVSKNPLGTSEGIVKVYPVDDYTSETLSTSNTVNYINNIQRTDSSLSSYLAPSIVFYFITFILMVWL